MNISLIKFNNVVQIGPESSVESYLTQGQMLLGFKLKIELDTDPRFLLLTGTHLDAGKKPYYQLIPLTAVSSLMIEKNGVPGSTTQAKKA